MRLTACRASCPMYCATYSTRQSRPSCCPPKDGEISQKTEDLVGPYELHDFFLYYMLRFGYPPRKIYRAGKENLRRRVR